MEIVIGLLIIAVGAFCQSSCYVPINKIKDWSWESYWIVQGVFAWILFPLLGIHFGLSFIVSVVIPVVLAGAAVERERNKDKQLLLYGIAC